MLTSLGAHSQEGPPRSGVILALKGSRTHLPITAISKRQSCVSHSTPEAEEMVAADTALTLVGLPATTILSELAEKQFEQSMEDEADSDRGEPKPKVPLTGQLCTKGS
eukprot:2807505-Amphidinium_carterae.6